MFKQDLYEGHHQKKSMLWYTNVGAFFLFFANFFFFFERKGGFFFEEQFYEYIINGVYDERVVYKVYISCSLPKYRLTYKHIIRNCIYLLIQTDCTASIVVKQLTQTAPLHLSANSNRLHCLDSCETVDTNWTNM